MRSTADMLAVLVLRHSDWLLHSEEEEEEELEVLVLRHSDWSPAHYLKEYAYRQTRYLKECMCVQRDSAYRTRGGGADVAPSPGEPTRPFCTARLLRYAPAWARQLLHSGEDGLGGDGGAGHGIYARGAAGGHDERREAARRPWSRCPGFRSSRPPRPR